MAWTNDVLYFLSKPVWGEILLTVFQISAWQTCWSRTATDCMQGVSAQRPRSWLLLAHLQVQVFGGETLLFFFFFLARLQSCEIRKKQISKELWCQLNRDQNERSFQQYKLQQKCDWIWKIGTSDVDEASAVNVFTVGVAATFTPGYKKWN